MTTCAKVFCSSNESIAVKFLICDDLRSGPAYITFYAKDFKSKSTDRGFPVILVLYHTLNAFLSISQEEIQDQTMNLLYDYWYSWRYEFNTNKSWMLFFCESHPDNERNARDRVFRLGNERVKEK